MHHAANNYLIVFEILYVILGVIFVFFLLKTVQADKKNHESVSSATERFFADILDNLPVSVLLLNENGVIVDANQAALKMYDYSKKQLINKPFIELAPQEVQARIAYELNCTLSEHGMLTAVHWKQLAAQGKMTDVKVWTAPIIVGQNTVTAVVITDITAEKKLENEMLSALEELDSFVYRAAHGLRSPLSQIIGVCKLVKAEGKIRDLNALAYFEMIGSASARMEYMISKLLVINSLKNRKPEILPVNILEAVSRVIEEVQLDKCIDITLLIEVPPQLTILSDEILINIILKNLLENAITHRDSSHRNAYVRIAAMKKDNQLIIIVNDNGIGIPKEAVPHLFKNNYTTVAGFTQQGSGMGLYASQTAAEKLGGKIELVDSKFGQTEFMVTLPLEPNTASACGASLTNKSRPSEE